jgi:hypothetical protein
MNRLPTAVLLAGLLAGAAVSLSSAAAEPLPSSQKAVPVRDTQQSDEAAGARSEVPSEILDKVRADAATRAGVDAASVKVISSEAVTWPNGALGCGKPGEMVTQAIVPGYRIELEANGQRYTYHTSERGRFRLCTGIARGRLPRSTDK